MVACCFHGLRTNSIHDEVKCLCSNFLGRALGFDRPNANHKTMGTDKPAGGVVFSQCWFILKNIRYLRCLCYDHRYCHSHSFFSQFEDEEQQFFCTLCQTTIATSMCTPCSHIHSLVLNHCLSLFHISSNMHGRVDVHVSASLHMTHALLLHQTRHGPNDVHLLMHREPPSPHHL